MLSVAERPALGPTTPPAGAADARLDRLEAFLTDLVAGLRPDLLECQQHGPGRPRILPALALWAGLVVCVLRGLSSHLALWRLLAGTGLWHFPPLAVSDQALYTAWPGDDAPLGGLFAALRRCWPTAWPPMPTAPWPPSPPGSTRWTRPPSTGWRAGCPACAGPPRAPTGCCRASWPGCFDLRRQQWARVEHQPAPQQNEKVAARELVADLPAGSLILADLGYFGFAWFDDLTDAGHWWVSRLREKTSYELLHAHYREGDTLDALVWLGEHRADRAKHAVRLVQFRRGQTLHRYVTNVLDPTLLPLAEIARLYARRWDIELAFNLVKTHLGLHLLWAASRRSSSSRSGRCSPSPRSCRRCGWRSPGAPGSTPSRSRCPCWSSTCPSSPRAASTRSRSSSTGPRSASSAPPAAPHRRPDHPAGGPVPPPADLALTRPPHHAHRNCGKRPRPARASPPN